MRQDSKYNERIGLTKQNKWGDTMKIIEYINANNIIVEFQDEYKEKKKSCKIEMLLLVFSKNITISAI